MQKHNGWEFDKMDLKENVLEEKKEELSDVQGAAEENPMIKKRWFGRGIYGSKDVPIRLLDGFIAVVVVVIVGMIVFFTVTGGFYVSFETGGGSEVAQQKLRHGELVAEPEEPMRPGYDFGGWSAGGEEPLLWDFEADKVQGDMTLTAVWTPAKIPVRFDPDGGTVNGSETVETAEVVFGESYGELPVPEKDGAEFEGWYYSGERITADTVVTMTGEHVLTAVWK